MSTQNIDPLVAEVFEKLKRDAYAAGWRDAITAINKAASDLAAPIIPKTIETHEVLSPPSEQVASKTTQPKLPTQGSTPWYVIQAVQKRPGMTGSEIVGAVKEGGHNAPEGSIRTSIFRMRDRKFVVSRHGKWFSA
jgi:hypothetical protein